MKSGTRCTACANSETCPAYDPRMAYGFCQGFQVAAVGENLNTEGSLNEYEFKTESRLNELSVEVSVWMRNGQPVNVRVSVSELSPVGLNALTGAEKLIKQYQIFANEMIGSNVPAQTIIDILNTPPRKYSWIIGEALQSAIDGER